MNELIDRNAVMSLRGHLTRAAPGRSFDQVERAVTGLDPLNLRARSDLISDALVADLPDDYPEVAAIFRRAIDDPGFDGWMLWPVTETVARLALAANAHEDGLLLLSELTPRFTGEFAIRPFLAADLSRALEVISPWTDSPDAHVRRLASEGTRPLLPWARRVRGILEKPESTVPIIDALYRDGSETVRRSAANHLNDLSRHQPGLAVEVAAGWRKDPDDNTARTVRHAMRTLVKKAHPGALELLGFGTASLVVSPLRLERANVQMPADLVFDVDITNDGQAPTRLAIDFVIHYVKSNGRHAEKVFKLATKELAVGETIQLRKKHRFQQRTTRVHHRGTHLLELQINGQRHGRSEFHVET